MSESEQHEIIGRTVVEHGKAKQRLAALQAKAREYAEAILAVSGAMSQDVSGVVSIGPGAPGKGLTAALDRYPEKAEVAGIMEELRATKLSVESLAKSLREMGVAV